MQDSFIGTNIEQHLTCILKNRNVKKVFLVRGNKSYCDSGAKAVLEKIFKEQGIDTLSFSDYSVNPKIDDVQKGVASCKQYMPDAIVAVGGGSALDTGKLIRYYYCQEQDCDTTLMALPTTAGSGAEATHFSVCYIDGEKQSISDDAIRPDYVFINPMFTLHNDAYLTACTGFDAVAQAIESYWSVKSTEESREFSAKALSLLWKQLPMLINDLDNEDLRSQVAEGAYYAGRAIDITTTTAPHAFSYKFTSLYGYPHGHAVALTFPFFWELNKTGNNLQPALDEASYLDRMNELFQIMGCSNIPICHDAVMMTDYIESLGLKTKSFSKDEILPIVDKFNKQRAGNNPVVIDDEVKSGLCCFLCEEY